jgi:hypothetical protein
MSGDTDEPEEEDASEPEQKTELIEFATFLERAPPSQQISVANLRTDSGLFRDSQAAKIATPDLYLYCDNERCKGERYFRYSSGNTSLGLGVKITKTFLTFRCSNCQKYSKTFALWLRTNRDDDDGQCMKFGESPAFGLPPTPTRLIRIFGNQRELFFKGRKCEVQGLGIAAFTYYRRVVENQKDQILLEIIKVAQKVRTPAETLKVLEDARKETQFTRALDMVKEAIPPALFINQQNPLTLLHSALSHGVHEKTDEECLELAHDTRVVLVELAERIGQALKDEEEINSAVGRLMKARDP